MSLGSRFSKIAFGSVVGLAAVLGAAVLVQPASGARPGGPPGPLCGPTIFFVCSVPGEDDVFVGLTICEVAAFERKTGRTCVPFGG